MTLTGCSRAGFGACFAIAAGGVIASTSLLASPTGTSEPTGATQSMRSCMDCHRFTSGLTHPVGVVPSMRTPAGLPLVNGAIDCVTCHDAPPSHAQEGARVGVRTDTSGHGLCLECHRANEAGHVAGGQAHLDNNLQHHAAAEAVDPESSSCMSCHDGVAAGDAPEGRSSIHDLGSHPIGRDARLTRPSSNDLLMAGPESIDKRVRLFDQAVGCGSCHSVYSQAKNLLVIDNLKSRLCLTCHRQ